MILLIHSTPAQEPKIRVTAPINNSRFMVGVLGLFLFFFFVAFFGLRDSLLLIGINTTPGRRHTSLSCCVRKDFGEKISNGFAVANFVNKESTESIDKVLKRKVEGESRYFMTHCIKPLEAKVSQLLFDENRCSPVPQVGLALCF